MTSSLISVLPNFQFVCVVKFGLIDCRKRKNEYIQNVYKRKYSVSPGIEHVCEVSLLEKNCIIFFDVLAFYESLLGCFRILESTVFYRFYWNLKSIFPL